MSEVQKQDIREMLDILNELNEEDLNLIKGGAMILKAKLDMESGCGLTMENSQGSRCRSDP